MVLFLSLFKKISIKKPILRSLVRIIYYSMVAPFKKFPGSEEYWKKRYQSGKTSGVGSYHQLAEYKAEVLNRFLREKKIITVIEYGCGDGNQLKLINYPAYIGFDVSPDAISRCKTLFSNDKTKNFRLMDDYTNETAQLTLSLDVVYHLIEEDIFSSYMERLFDSSKQYVIIYSSNRDKQAIIQGAHIKHRNFSKWIEQNRPRWKLVEHIPNRYPYKKFRDEGSLADFYIYQKDS
jgi:SAM-dependent methyltransferase